MTLDDLRNLNINDVPSWPLPFKLGGIGLVCAFILFAGYWFMIKGQLEAYAEEQSKEQTLRDTYSNKKLLAINLEGYRQQMIEMEQAFGTLLRQLPNTTEVPDLLVDITQAGLGRGLEFVLFQPQSEQPRDFYAELPISVQVTGSYHELAQFISDVAMLPRIVTFGDISVSGKDRLAMTATARTYRYLDVPAAAKAAPGSTRVQR